MVDHSDPAARPDGGSGKGRGYPDALLFTVLGQVVLGTTRLGALVLIGRLAGKETLGEAAALLAVGTFLVLAWPQPAGAAASRYIAMASVADTADPRHAVESFTSRTVLVACLPLSATSGVVAACWFSAGWAGTLWSALLPACLGAAAYARGVRYGRLRFRDGLLWDCLGAIATIASMSAVLVTGRFEHALMPLCLGYLVSALPGWPRHRPSVPLSADHRREVTRYTAWTAVQVVAAGGLIHVVMALAALHASASDLGEFAAALSIATPILLLSIALRTSLTPFVARQVAAGDQESLRRATDSLMRTMVVLFVPALGAACIWSRELLLIIFGAGFAGSANVLVILLLGVSLNCFNASHVWLGVAAPWGPRALAVCNGAGLVVGTGVAAVGASLAPATWAATGYLTGSLVGAGSAAVIVWRRGRMRWWPLALRLGVGYALIASAVVATGDADAWPKVMVSAAFVVAYAGVCWSDVRRVALLIPRPAPQSSPE